jgi:hypothetical protein
VTRAARASEWAEALAELVPDLALGVGAWAGPIYALLGPLSAARPEPVGDPDGFDGLARRGTYERLTPFEWLLADEAPDEFVRRAAAGEHAFWRLAYRGPAGSRRCAALVVGGAELLGAPRLVTLAALLALARRAAEARADFLWGYWGPGGPALCERLEPEGVRQWLREGRALEGPAADDVAAFFAERLRPAAADDAWLLGGDLRAGGAPPPGVARLAVAPALDFEGRRCLVALDRPGAARRSIELALPEPTVCARWLRAPFAPPAPAPPAIAASREPRALPDVAPTFSHDGRRLFVRIEGGGVAAYVVPNSAAARPVAPVHLRPQAGGHLVAAAARGKTLWAVEACGRELRLHRFSKRGGVGWTHTFRPAEVAECPFEPAPPAALFVAGTREGPAPDRPFASFAAGDLLIELAGDARWHVRARDVIATAGWHGGVLAARIDRERVTEGLVLEARRPNGELVTRSAGGAPGWSRQETARRSAHFGAFSARGCGVAAGGEYNGAPGPSANVWRLWAVPLSPWTAPLTSGPPLETAPTPAELDVPAGARVLGVTTFPSHDHLALVTLDPSGRTFDWAHDEHVRGTILTAPAPVVAAAFCPVRRALAYRASDGALVVRLLDLEQDVLRVAPTAGPP